MERPILFSTEMVQAILAGRKIQTRRTNGLKALNAQKIWVYSHNSNTGEVIRPAKKYDSDPWYLFYPHNSNEESWIVQCPYGKPGDILWVRETFTEWPKGSFQYKASTANGEELGKWKPSIHMPKAAARIWLEITDVKVERLKSISEDDAEKEGIETKPYYSDNATFCTRDYSVPIHNDGFWPGFCFNDGNQFSTSFKTLWSAINGELSWYENPWVWVVEFKRIEKQAQ